MESKTVGKLFSEKHPQDGICPQWAVNLSKAYPNQQNATLVEAIDCALQTIILQSEGKSIGNLDERISHFERILKENGK